MVMATQLHDPLNVYNTQMQRAGIGNQWAGCAAFLVLGGPSMKQLPMEVLAERGVLSLGVNNSAARYRTTAFIASDPPDKFHHGIWFDPKVIKFVPSVKHKDNLGGLREKHGRTFRWSTLLTRHCPSVYYFDRCEDLHQDDCSAFFTNPKAYWGRNKKAMDKFNSPFKIMFTPFLAFRLLHFMGVREVYCLGMDFSMDEKNKYAWEQGRDKAAIRANCNIYKNANKVLAGGLAKVFDDAGFRVLNCNPRSGCPHFPHVPFDKALKRVRGAVPEEPFDLKGWYESSGLECTDDPEDIARARAEKDSEKARKKEEKAKRKADRAAKKARQAKGMKV